jgi:hypothetical protein
VTLLVDNAAVLAARKDGSDLTPTRPPGRCLRAACKGVFDPPRTQITVPGDAKGFDQTVACFQDRFALRTLGAADCDAR